MSVLSTSRKSRRLSGCRLRISEEGCRILRAVNPAAAERVAASGQPLGRGWVRAELPFESPGYSARQLLRLGTEVEVLAPAELRCAVRLEAERVCRLYVRPKASVRRPAGTAR